MCRLMSKRFSLEEIREFWQQQALIHGQSSAASWSDLWAIEMEIREIVSRLSDGDRVLDIGCANGYSTVRFALQKRIQIRGIDYIPEMIAQARSRLDGMADQLRGTIEFGVGDIMALDEPSGEYDKVIVIRVIINLSNWERQLKGLRESTRVLKPGGLLLLSEATRQGWQRLNQFRGEWGLPEIPMPPFNQYLDQKRVIDALNSKLDLVELVDFSSTYYVGTRVLKPLLIQALGANVDVANPNMEWNRWFAHLPACGDYGVQRLFVFKKR
jgi:ubiquinone/menaquinone biosynthesis C-methylase UbiE